MLPVYNNCKYISHLQSGLQGIHQAAYDGKLDEVKEYVQNGVDVNDKLGDVGVSW